MNTTTVSLVLALAALTGVGAGRATAQPILESAVTHYEAADYEGALAALDAASPAAASTVDRVAIDHYRVLCLLALGRRDEAQAATSRVFTLHPTYALDADSSPRVRALFDDVRTRMLPDLIRARYADAKAHFDAGRFVDAATGFAVVADLGRTARPTSDAGPPLGDLLMVASGFQQLATTALERARAAEAAAPAPPAAAAPVPPPTTRTPATKPAPPEYALGAQGVVPPVVISQSIGAWHRNVPRPRAGAPLGTVEVLIDETGAVVDARVVSSVSAFYDAVLLESAKSWRYRPAFKDGQPVRFRRAAVIVAGG